tara:strand:- start:117 stop:701 length:585 start_codon:yes stop_codon:yes gene_type:complete
MKRLLAYLFIVLGLGFTFNANAEDNDIRDFQIEGMSIGDSALDYFTKEEIKKNSQNYYKDKTFTPVQMDNFPFFKTYSSVDFVYKTNDPKYIIHSIYGVIDYKNIKIDRCYNKLDIIVDDLRIFLTDFQEIKKKVVTPAFDPKGKITRVIFLTPEGGIIAVNCYDYSLANGGGDHLGLEIVTKKFNDWLLTEQR